MVKQYKEDPDYDYLVIDNPFGLREPGQREAGSQEFALLGEWFKVMLSARYNPIEAVYWTATVCLPLIPSSSL